MLRWSRSPSTDLDVREQISLDGITPRSRQLNNKRPSGNGS